MSLSKVLRGAEAEAVSLWELPSVDGNVVNQRDEPADPPEPEEPQIQLPTEEEVESIREEARQAGFSEGREAGYAEGERKGQAASEKAAKKVEKEQRQRLKTLDSLIHAQARPLEQLDDEVQDQLLSLVLTLARQVIRRELQMQPGEILGVIRESVALLPLAERDVTVRVHPEDHRFLQELLGEESDERAWTLVDDPALSRGGCVVQAQRARVDASLETRLAQLASQLLGAREEDLRDDDGVATAEEPPVEALTEDQPAEEHPADEQPASADDTPPASEPDSGAGAPDAEDNPDAGEDTPDPDQNLDQGSDEERS